MGNKAKKHVSGSSIAANHFSENYSFILNCFQELEEDADQEVEKILFEVTKGQLGTGEALNTPLVGEEEPGPAELSSDDENALKSRLAALRS